MEAFIQMLQIVWLASLCITIFLVIVDMLLSVDDKKDPECTHHRMKFVAYIFLVGLAAKASKLLL